MSDWKPDWDRRLALKPFKKQRFHADLMENVEQRIKIVERKRSRHRFRRIAMIFIPALLLMLGAGIWFGGKEVPIHNPADPSPTTQGGGSFESSFELGGGGGFEWWSFDREGLQGNDDTIVKLALAFMNRELGIWGGPTPDIWETPEVKEPLERFDVSSPWVYEVYVQEVRTEEEQTVYRLRLQLRDSIPMVYQETIDITIRNNTHKISLIELVNTDETGTPLDEYESEAVKGRTVTLKEDPKMGLKITGTLSPNEGMIRSIRVQYKDKERIFQDWSNVNNDSYYPEAGLLTTLDNEEDVLAVIMTTGYGTGVHESVLRLLRSDFTEVKAADPVLTAESKIQADVKTEAGKRILRITLDGVTRTFEYNEEEAGIWQGEPALGSIVNYSVEGNTLYASIPAQVWQGEFPVAVRLRYEYDGTSFLVAEAMFEEI
ncbi:hypothetical protein [Paenibacillus solani]|uniref:Uncharacterized protein n=1 Tax=Paenibacillus solani TaxID=1705565 RepID=A0A0M1P5C0_9BACL|nr:hypothetical protein [Paenibacillus solani]KOR89597.1 hypothetical protein AM231_10915 [Paenibacillus solani]